MRIAMQYADWKRTLAGQILPAAVVDLDAFDRNVESVAGHCGGKPLRLATKSVRAVELIRRALARGKPFQGLMCYSAREALWLAKQGFDDLLVAYPTAQPADICALFEAQAMGRRVLLVVDSVAHLEAIARAAPPGSAPLPVVADIDLSLRLGFLHIGVRRSPLHDAAGLRAFLRESRRFAGAVRPVGMMAYEAQVAGLGDRNPFKRAMNPIAALLRRYSARRAARLRSELARAWTEDGFALEIFNGGGTGSLNWAAAEPWLTEVTAGSALFSPHLFDYFSNLRFEPAAFFALPVSRSSDAGFVTCFGGGYVASGEPGWDRVPRPWLPEGLKLVSFEGTGEVQTPLEGARGLSPGDPVLFRHAKAGELLERFDEVLLASKGAICGRARTYRGDGATFG